jgi:hypothetical protein
MQKYTTMTGFLNSLNDDQRAQVESLRKIIFTAEPSLVENIKWNTPNYVYKNQDRITFNVLNKENKVKLILHKGAKEKEDKKAEPIMTDNTQLVTWISNIRGIIILDDLTTITKNAPKLKRVLKQWLAL